MQELLSRLDPTIAIILIVAGILALVIVVILTRRLRRRQSSSEDVMGASPGLSGPVDYTSLPLDEEPSGWRDRFANLSLAGKILAIFFPVMAFVALGFDHVVANMFFLPVAIFAGVPDLSWGDALHNWLFAFLGNVAGATIFVAASYWFLYARAAYEEPGDAPSGAPERSPVPAELAR